MNEFFIVLVFAFVFVFIFFGVLMWKNRDAGEKASGCSCGQGLCSGNLKDIQGKTQCQAQDGRGREENMPG